MNNNNKFILYARKSEESDERQVQSNEDQINFCKNKAKAMGLEIVATFTDEKSAKAPFVRTGFTSMMKMILEEELGGIICWKLDRLTRNPVDTGSIQYTLQKGDIKKIITNDREYLPGDSGLLFSVETGMANQFILDLSKNTKRGMKGKADRGGLGGPAPHGYLNDRLNKTVFPDPERFDMIKRMWHLILKNKYKLPQICEIANEWGFRTIQKKKVGGCKLGTSSLYTIFTNPFYAGKIRFKNQILPGSHEPMVTYEEFHEVQKILKRNSETDRPSKREFSLTGCMKCAECGCSITAEHRLKTTSSGRKIEYTYYHCTHRKDTKDYKCNQRGVYTEQSLESQIISILSGIEIRPEFTHWSKSVLHRLYDEESVHKETVFEVLTKRIEEVQKKQRKLLPLFMDELITEDEYKSTKQVLDDELRKLEGDRNGTSMEQKSWIETMEDVLDFVTHAKTRFITGDIPTKKLIFKSLGSNLFLRDGRLHLEAHSWFQPFQKMNEEILSPESRFEPVTKSTSMRDTDALGCGKTIWLPG